MARGAAANLRAEQVIESGLGLYSQGDLVGALKRWRQALEIDPDNRRAREYVTYVEEHYEVLDRKLRGERAAPPEGDEPGPTIEMEADDPMDEIDAYDSVEVSMPVADALDAADLDESGVPTQEMKAQQLADAMAAAAAAESDEEATGETTKAEGLAGMRRAAARKSSPPVSRPVPVPVLEESVDEGWSLDGLEDALGLKSEVDTLEAAPGPDLLDDLSDLGAGTDTLDAYAGEGEGPDLAEGGGEEEPASALQRPSDDHTGEVTRPERRPHSDSGRQRAGTRSTAPAPSAISGAVRGRPSTAPPPSIQSPRAEFDLADFDDPDAPGLGPVGASALTARPAAASEEGAEVRVTFRSPRDSDLPRPGGPPATARARGEAPTAPAPTAGGGDGPVPAEDDEATVDRLRPPVSFEDETYERPSLSMLSEVGGDLDSLYGDADSDDLRLERRPGSEGDTGLGDSSERETTQLYQRAMRPSKGAVSMELIAAELEADLDEAVSIDPSLGEDAIKARVGWLINRARSENQAGHFPVAVVAIDLALEQHPDSAVAQKLIHSNREVLYEVYRSFLGDLRAVPSLAMAMEKIPMHELDHRAAFLLSRIDGALTLEDVLDVSGMARLEAFRHLSRLLLRGILEIRS